MKEFNMANAKVEMTEASVKMWKKGEYELVLINRTWYSRWIYGDAVKYQGFVPSWPEPTDLNHNANAILDRLNKEGENRKAFEEACSHAGK